MSAITELIEKRNAMRFFKLQNSNAFAGLEGDIKALDDAENDVIEAIMRFEGCIGKIESKLAEDLAWRAYSDVLENSAFRFEG